MTPAEAANHLDLDGFGAQAVLSVSARDHEDVDLTAEELEGVWRHLDRIEPGNAVAEHVQQLAQEAEAAEWRDREAETAPANLITHTEGETHDAETPCRITPARRRAPRW